MDQIKDKKCKDCDSYTGCDDFKPNQYIGHKDPSGPRGMPMCCPACGARSNQIHWDTKLDKCTCVCGWTNGINYKYFYETLPEKIRVELRHYGPADKFDKVFFINLIDEIIKEN